MTGAKILRKTAIVIALALWTLAFGELFMRLIEPQALMPRYVTGTPYGIRGNIPGATYHHYTPDVSVEYRINRQGMRDDRTFADAKPAGTCRIAMLGDSYFVGYELDLKDTIAHRIEAGLRAAGYKVEVLNFAVSGFGTAENLIAYRKEARAFHPDLVLMQWQVTDYDDNVRSGLFALKDGALVQTSDRFLPGVATQDKLMKSALYRTLADHSQLYNFLREQIGWRAKQLLAFVRKREAGPAGGEEVEQNTYLISPIQVRLAAALLTEAKAEVERDGAHMMVVDIPNRTPERVFSSSYDLMPPEVKQALPPVDAIPLFRQALKKDGATLFFPHGARHLTPTGAALLSGEAIRRIEESGTLRGCR
ncbi:SGNH/GDSL hydrolase family protein [Flavisphingomonas formosensis]|uniref:SGNH/GDSL hydrolase family protein n=1 Tax=Flavisphingomonas formosensis TaxID=861534 RepID=UPI0012F8E95B|nr:SGNH/GDSL hydrolase family protein [Sphingomonas formosensis]